MADDNPKPLTDDELALNRRLDELVSRGMEKTSQWTSLWQENLRYFFSDQLHGQLKRKNWEWVVLNYIWPSAVLEISKLTKHDPKIIAKPWEESDSDAAEVWESHLQWQWHTQNMRYFQMKALHDKKLFGISVTKVFWEDDCYWDDEQKMWMGDVKTVLWHPAHFWADDDENILNGNCGTDRYVPLDWAISRWPEFKAELEAASQETEDAVATASGDTIRGQTTYTGGVGGQDTGIEKVKATPLLEIIVQSDQMSGVSASREHRKLVKIQEFYLKDYETQDVKEEQDVPPEELVATGHMYQSTDGGYRETSTNKPMGPDNWPKMTLREYKEPKYPNGRFIIRAGTTVLNPKYEDQRYKHRHWPFIVSPHYIIPHLWRGIDGVQMYKSTQDMINISASHLYNNMKQFGDPRVWVEEDAVITKRGKDGKGFKIFGGAGSISIFKRGALSRNKARIEPPVPGSQAAAQMYQLFVAEYKNVQGLHSIARGEKIPGKMTATEAQNLAVNSVDRIAFQAAVEDMWIREWGTRTAELGQFYYEPGRIIRIVGEDKTQGVIEISQGLKSVKYDVDIIPGTTLPFDEEKRIERYLTAYRLLSEPVANPMLPDVLRVLEIHNWKKILAQHEVYQQYLQFVQLYESVVSGKIAPDIAVNMLVQKAMELYQSNPMAQGQQATQERQAAQQKPPSERKSA